MTLKQQAKLRAEIKTHILNLDIEDHKTDTATVLAYTKIGKFGIKMYQHQRDRDFGFRNQTKYHGHRIAPRAYFRGTVKLAKTELDNDYDSIDRVYYYVTDHATEFWAANKTQKTTLRQEWKRLKKKLDRFGISTGDYSHDCNTGLLRKKIVVIDFDQCSLRQKRW